MPADRFGAPWPGATYNGFSGGPPPQPERAPPRRQLSRGTLIGGIAAIAIALGLAAGLLLRPDHRSLSEDQLEAKAGPHVPIEIGKPPPPTPMPRPAGKLDVLDAASASSAAAAAARPAPVAPARAAPPPSSWAAPPTTLQVGEPAPPAEPPARVAQAAPPPLVVVPPPAAPAARDPCAAARGRAEALVCADPEIANYDRELNRAYRRAMRSGAVSPEDLRADQRDWLADRETAARRSPNALADTYQSRIDELNRIADDGPGDFN